jgi:hypothetical protein
MRNDMNFIMWKYAHFTRMKKLFGSLGESIRALLVPNFRKTALELPEMARLRKNVVDITIRLVNWLF